jgi:hypothetical protein
MNELDLFRDFRRGVAPPSSEARRQASALLAGAVAGARVSRTRRGGLRGSLAVAGRRRRLVLLAAALVVAVVGTASAFGTVREFFLDRGFIGLPPEGAAQSAPDSGELVLRWLGRSAPGMPLFRVWVYADGRMIWSRHGSIPEGANELTSGLLEQRLTPEGVELLRSEVIGLLEGSGIPLETVPSDDEPRRFGVEVRDGDRLVRANGEGSIATPEQLAARRRVGALLTDAASVLPPSAWAVREIRAYVPSYYQVCMDTSPPKDLSQLLALLPVQAADVLRGKSLEWSESGYVEAREGGRTVVIGRSATYCTKLSTEETREVAEPLSGLDQDPRFHRMILAYRLAEPVANLNPTSIWFEPYLPHGKVTCSACA